MLEEYIEKGFLLVMFLRKAEAGKEVKFLNGTIEIDGKRYGNEYSTVYTMATLEEAAASS